MWRTTALTVDPRLRQLPNWGAAFAFLKDMQTGRPRHPPMMSWNVSSGLMTGDDYK
jgi:hypothetical protein